MADLARLSHEDVRSVARMAHLSLLENRLDQLTTTLSAYLDLLERLRHIEPGECEPPAMTYESEWRS